MTMEPEQDPVPLLSEGPEHRVTMDQVSVERFMSKVTENALGFLDFSRQWKEYEKDMELVEESVRKQAMELQKKEKDSDLKYEELKRELQLRKEELEAREKELSFLDETILEKSNELKKKEEKFQLKQDAEARDIEVKSKNLEHKEMKLEEVMRELDVKQKELSFLDETIKEKSNDLKKKEENFQLKQDAEARDIDVKSKNLELKEKKLEELMREFDVNQKELSLRVETIQWIATELEKREEQFQLIQDGEVRDVEVKSKSLELKEKKLEEVMRELDVRQKELSLIDETIKEKSTDLEKREEQFQLKMNSLELKKKLEEMEEVLVRKDKELYERSKQAENSKRCRDEFESRDEDSLIHPGKKHKPIREHNHDDNEKETDSNCELYGKTSSDFASATTSQAKGRELYEAVCIDDGSDPASAGQAMGREINEVVCIDDESDEDPEPYNCPDSDFNDFNNRSSFVVGQVWALYDPLDHMPRCYAQIKRFSKRQLSVGVTWLESRQTTEMEKPIPIACGEFKYGEKATNSHLMFSHEMHHIKISRSVIIISPRKGETWALFRDWTPTWNSHKRPYRYDFVQVVSELDSDYGIGVAYLGRVEGFTSVYKLAEQHGILQVMIPCEEMLRFSHRVPSFRLTGDEKEGVPAGSFELDPAAIPKECLEASKVKEEES